MKNSLLRGFTLLELLIVIAIIGTLSGIILPRVNEAREKAQISKTKVENESLTQSIEIDKLSTNPFTNPLETAFGVNNHAECSKFAAESQKVCERIIAHGNKITIFKDENHYISLSSLSNGRTSCRDSQGKSNEIPFPPLPTYSEYFPGPWTSCQDILDLYETVSSGGEECLITFGDEACPN